ncbi:hypothetical protein EZS27_025400 [termite gut metagenome]|uniref:Uncharacterized protein n=1 Tax=termite gut metagenome TaxID=433724 RepID=A0A5J4QY16_9ZZZZ
MANTFSTPSKIKIRQEWNLPILKLISERTGKKLIYLGLPSPDVDDIYEWIDYIDNVIAFQCRKYPKPSEPSQSKEALDLLETKLNTLETQGKISTFTIYDGYIEEVLLRGRDISNNIYSQNEVITLYNLDYCNSLSVPIPYIDSDGNEKKGYKFDAIKKLMEFQNRIQVASKKFILFLTIKCDYYEGEMGVLINEGCDANLKPIHQQYDNIKDIFEKKARLLRSYTIQNLKAFFISNGFIPEFLPTINYNGKPIPRSKNDFILLHFSVLGTQMTTAAGIAPFYQKIDELIKQNFIYVRNGNVQDIKIPNIEEMDVQYTPEDYITGCDSFVKHWIQNE